MQVLRWTLTGCLIVCLGGCSKDAKSSGEQILGTWELTKASVDYYKVLRAHYKDDKNALQRIEAYKEFEDLMGKDREIVQDAIGIVTPPPGASSSVEFLKDGKMKQILKEKGQRDNTIRESTYEIVGNTLKLVMANGHETRAAIEKLTDTELVISILGDVNEYKKK